MKFRSLHLKGHSATRAKLGLTQRQLADQLGISKAALSMAETGRRHLPATAKLKLSELETKLAAAMEANKVTGTEKRNADLAAEAPTQKEKLLQKRNEIQLKKMALDLELMTERYNQLQTQLQLLDHILENEPGETNQGLILGLRVQRDNLVSKILKCNPRKQARLRNRMALLNAEINGQ